MEDFRSCSWMLGVGVVLAASFLWSVDAEAAVVGPSVVLQGSVDPEPRQDRRYEYFTHPVVPTSGRRYNLHDISENRYRPTINTHLFPQLAINYDIEWIHPHHHKPNRPESHPDYHPDPRPDNHNHEHRPKITTTLTKTITKGPTVFWTEFVPFCSLDPLPSKCSVANKVATVTTTDTSRVLHIRENTYTYQDAYCLSITTSMTTETSTIDVTTTATPAITVTATVGNHLTNTKTIIVPTTVVKTESTTTTIYATSTIDQDCYGYFSTTTIPFPGPTTTIFETQTETNTDTYTVNDVSSCSLAVTVTEALGPTTTLTVLPYIQTLSRTTTTLTTDLGCSSRLFVVTETLPATVKSVVYEATFVYDTFTSTGDPNFVCPDTVTVTTTNAVPQSTTTSREATLTIVNTVVDTAFTLQEFYWCGAARTTTTETHTLHETSTRVITVDAASTTIVPEPACMVGHGPPNHGCPQEFLMAVKMIMIEITELFIDLRALLHELKPHVNDRHRGIIERFNNLPLQEILGHLPLKEQRDEALWSQKQLLELKDIASDVRTLKETPDRLFDKINVVVTRLQRIHRSLEKRS